VPPGDDGADRPLLLAVQARDAEALPRQLPDGIQPRPLLRLLVSRFERRHLLIPPTVCAFATSAGPSRRRTRTRLAPPSSGRRCRMRLGTERRDGWRVSPPGDE